MAGLKEITKWVMEDAVAKECDRYTAEHIIALTYNRFKKELRNELEELIKPAEEEFGEELYEFEERFVSPYDEKVMTFTFIRTLKEIVELLK